MERSCIDCGHTGCNFGDHRPEFCLTTFLDEDILAEAMAEYEKEDIKRVAISAAEVEAENYMKMTRIEETMEFARKIGAKKIGIACCGGLQYEGRIVAKVLRLHGFEVYGVVCKAGMQKKVDLGAPEHCTVVGEYICNPILQAKLLNKEKTDLNIIVGLCVGHDALFNKYSDALVTTLIAKDRVLAHNPVAALYQSDKYYRRITTVEEK